MIQTIFRQITCVASLVLIILVPQLSLSEEVPVATRASDAPQVDTWHAAALEAWKRIEAGATIVDVRSAEEFAGGHLEGAINIPHNQLLTNLNKIGEDKHKSIVLYCGTGRRAGVVDKSLGEQGYDNVLNAGGLEGLLKRKPASHSNAAIADTKTE